jgi:hypothetical protein
LSCTECGHKYAQPFTLDMASFFGDASWFLALKKSVNWSKPWTKNVKRSNKRP